MKTWNWKSYVCDFCTASEYPLEATEALLEGLLYIEENRIFRTCYAEQLQSYELSHKRDDIAASVVVIEENLVHAKISMDMAKFLFYILCTRHLKNLYVQRGYPNCFFVDLQKDMKAKLMESYKMNRVWGTFVGGWYVKFLALERFAIGRLVYGLEQTPACVSANGRYCFDGEPALMIHIPSTGPLRRSEVQKSMRDAAVFFQDAFTDGQVLFMCRSWLLFPGHYEMLPASSGIRQFMEEFEIIYVDIDNTKRNLWRIFGTKDTEDLSELPRDTSLQRAYIDWMAEGRPVGDGLGFRYVQLSEMIGGKGEDA